MRIEDLPALNASLNALASVFLIFGWWFIRTERKRQHIAMMVCALVTSAVFLVSYLTYHFNVAAVTRFTAQGIIRPIYFTILITHIILAAVVLPMVIMTVIPALRSRFDRHRRFARWTLPVWLYVSVTGVLVYLFLYHWYPPIAVPASVPLTSS
jgi:uncharacterized membrane protein YozB (DUF420 family)